MGRRIAARAKIVHGANQPLTEVMLPNAIDDHAGQQCPGAVIQISHPDRQRPPLLG